MNKFSAISVIFKRELKSYFESPVAYVFIIAYLVLHGCLTFFLSHYYLNGQADLKHAFFNLHPLIYLFLIPAVSMRLWAEEKQSKTIELLLTQPISLTQAIIGKFLASWTFLIITQLLTLPIVFTTIYLGNPDMGKIVAGYAGTILLAAAYLSIGTATSAMTKNQVISFVISFLICLTLLLLGSPIVNSVLSNAPHWLLNGISGVSFIPHYESLQRGVLDLRDIFYYITFTSVWLYLAHTILDRKKAS